MGAGTGECAEVYVVIRLISKLRSFVDDSTARENWTFSFLSAFLFYSLLVCYSNTTPSIFRMRRVKIAGARRV